MKYRLNILFRIIITTFILIGCTNKSNSQKNDIMLNNTDPIKNLLIRELSAGGIINDIDGTYLITMEDFKITNQIIDSLLKNRGYISPSLELYKERMKLFFKMDIQTDTIQAIGGNKDYYQKGGVYARGGYNNLDVIYSDSHSRVITKYLYLPQLIDYQRYYPDYNIIEEELPTDTIENYINRWKDIKDLDKQRKWTLDLLFHCNNYIIHSNKASLTWLLNNDQDFLTSLLKTFGYDKELRINEMVIEDAYKEYKKNEHNLKYNYDAFENVLFTKNENDTLKINFGVLNSIEDMTTREDSQYLYMFFKYLNSIKVDTIKTNLTKEEKIQVFCHFAVVEIKLRKKYPALKGDAAFSYFSALLCGTEYQEIAKKYNYWNIPNFDEIIQIEEWDYLIVNEGEEKEPFDYNTLAK